MIEFLGWISAACLAMCGLPLAIQCVRRGSSSGISPTFAGLWLAGEVVGLAYVLCLEEYPLIANYSINTLFCLIVAYYVVKDLKCRK